MNSSSTRICPFVHDPFSSCYLSDMGSQSIEKAIYYCGQHFEECEIYTKAAAPSLPDGWFGASSEGHSYLI